MAVTITNIAARQITCSGSGAITWGSWSTTLESFSTGSYNSGTKYVAQCRFQLSKPCSEIKFQVRGYASGVYGTAYWKVSTNESDTNLAKASYISGQSYDASTFLEGEYDTDTVTIKGPFAANTNYYIYGFHYAPGDDWTCVPYYALYSSDYCTKVIGATELQGAIYIDNGSKFEAYQVYIDNGSSWDLYLPYIDSGSSWNLCG